MLFNSVQFLAFFPLIVAAYFLAVRVVKRNWFTQSLLLVASLYFYMNWNPMYLILILLSVFITWASGIMMEGKKEEQKKLVLFASLASNFAILFFFKYYNFFADSIIKLGSLLNLPIHVPVLNVLLPVGISFYTFQALGYSIDVYRGTVHAERNFITYALFVTFFPQLVAGPIERTGNLLPQFKTDHGFDYNRVTNGLKLIVWGMFKKVVIADRLSKLVNTVYNRPFEYDGLPFLIATIFFAFQIYCDFSGYSDIAIGSAQVLGFRLMDNFKRPYFSKSISEFWKRWHVSLSRWFKDYLYISIGGNRVLAWRWQLNLFVTFVVSGLWHGASWTFLIWGALNGFYLVFSIWTGPIRVMISDSIGLSRHPHIKKFWQVASTFTLVCFAWVFFRANSVSDAVYIVTHLFSGFGNISNFNYVRAAIGSCGLSSREFFVAVSSIFFMELVHLIQRHGSIRHMFSEKPVWIRWGGYYALVLGIVFFGVFGANDFIYFQF